MPIRIPAIENWRYAFSSDLEFERPQIKASGSTGDTYTPPKPAFALLAPVAPVTNK